MSASESEFVFDFLEIKSVKTIHLITSGKPYKMDTVTKIMSF